MFKLSDVYLLKSLVGVKPVQTDKVVMTVAQNLTAGCIFTLHRRLAELFQTHLANNMISLPPRHLSGDTLLILAFLWMAALYVAHRLCH